MIDTFVNGSYGANREVGWRTVRSGRMKRGDWREFDCRSLIGKYNPIDRTFEQAFKNIDDVLWKEAGVRGTLGGVAVARAEMAVGMSLGRLRLSLLITDGSTRFSCLI
jgi:hypothetical protein